jgi:hypothetical protein
VVGPSSPFVWAACICFSSECNVLAVFCTTHHVGEPHDTHTHTRRT